VGTPGAVNTPGVPTTKLKIIGGVPVVAAVVELTPAVESDSLLEPVLSAAAAVLAVLVANTVPKVIGVVFARVIAF
jgi:hypothetical protein